MDQATIDGDVLKQELGEMAFQSLVARSMLKMALLRIQDLESAASDDPGVAGSDEPAAD